MYLFTHMFLFCLTIKTYLSPQLFLYLPTDVSVHDPTCSFSFRLAAEIYPSTFLLLYMYADEPGYQYTCSVYFFLFGITCTLTVPLICWGMYTQIHTKINLPVYLLCLRTKTYLSPQLHVYLPLNVPVHDPTCLLSYFYSTRLTTKIYPSTFLQLYMSTDISVHQYTCLVSFLLFGITCTVTFPLIARVSTHRSTQK